MCNRIHLCAHTVLNTLTSTPDTTGHPWIEMNHQLLTSSGNMCHPTTRRQGYEHCFVVPDLVAYFLTLALTHFTFLKSPIIHVVALDPISALRITNDRRVPCLRLHYPLLYPLLILLSYCCWHHNHHHSYHHHHHHDHNEHLGNNFTVVIAIVDVDNIN